MTALTEINLETQLPAILAEWLAGWFDGNWHSVGGNEEVEFPRAALAFGQGAPPKLRAAEPGEPAAEIRLIVQSGKAERLSQSDDTERLGVDHATLIWQVRSQADGPGQAEYQCARVATLLHAVLNNPSAWGAICAAGVRHLFPRRPEVLPQTAYAMRVMFCRAQLQYGIKLGNAE